MKGFASNAVKTTMSGRRARAGRRGGQEPETQPPGEGQGQLDYLDPDLLGGDSPEGNTSPRARSRTNTPRKPEVGSHDSTAFEMNKQKHATLRVPEGSPIAGDFDDDTDDEAHAPPNPPPRRRLDTGWGDEGGDGHGDPDDGYRQHHDDHPQQQHEPPRAASTGGFFDDEPPAREYRQHDTRHRGVTSPTPRAGGIAADFDDESPARPKLGGRERRVAREMASHNNAKHGWDGDDGYMEMDDFEDHAVRGGRRGSLESSPRGSPDPTHHGGPSAGRRQQRRGRDGRRDAENDLERENETAVDAIQSIPDADGGYDEYDDDRARDQPDVANVPRGYRKDARFVMPDQLDAPGTFDPEREEYKREGREDDDVDLSPLIENLLTREEVFCEDMNEVWTADSLWAEIRGVLQGEMDEKARLREELERLEIEKEKAKM